MGQLIIYLENLEAVRDSFLSWGIIPAHRNAILKAYHRLCSPVAVRSSLVGEDSKKASFAGQLDTVLNVSGDEDVLAAVRKCLASAFGSRLWAYVFQKDLLAADGMSIAVIVQSIVEDVFAPIFEEVLGHSGADYSRLIQRIHSRAYADVTMFGELLSRAGLPSDFFEAVACDDNAPEPRPSFKPPPLPLLFRETRYGLKQLRLEPRLLEWIAGDEDLDIRAELETSIEGRRLTGHFDMFMRCYGFLSANGSDFSEIPWDENPRLIWKTVARISMARTLARWGDADARRREAEILVVRVTNAGWKPFLCGAAGLVSEMGGLLSHSSIIARELGIPAVVGVRKATSRILEGQLITVDATAGRVYLHPPERAAD